jgi:hypothetical protein
MLNELTVRMIAPQTISAATLDFRMSEYLTVRQFVYQYGKLIDGWQNRNLCHVIRAKIVIRAHFFLMAWRAYIVNPVD